MKRNIIYDLITVLKISNSRWFIMTRIQHGESSVGKV